MIKRTTTTWRLGFPEEAQAAHRAVARAMRSAGPKVIRFPIEERAHKIREDIRRHWNEMFDNWVPSDELYEQGQQDAMEALAELARGGDTPPAA